MKTPGNSSNPTPELFSKSFSKVQSLPDLAVLKQRLGFSKAKLQSREECSCPDKPGSQLLFLSRQEKNALSQSQL